MLSDFLHFPDVIWKIIFGDKTVLGFLDYMPVFQTGLAKRTTSLLGSIFVFFGRFSVSEHY
jgi:hypothetical protein